MDHSDNRLLHLEERLSKLQSVCETAGLLPTSVRSDSDQQDELSRPGDVQKVHCQTSNSPDTIPPRDTELTRSSLPALSQSRRVASNVIQETSHDMVFSSKVDVVAENHGLGPEIQRADWATTCRSQSHPEDMRPVYTVPDDDLLIRPPRADDTRAVTDFSSMVWPDACQPASFDSPFPIAGDALCEPIMDTSACLDSIMHFQTLSMIFADTSETRLLEELPSMIPQSTPVPLPPRDATYEALSNFFRYFDKLMPLFDEASTFHLIELFYGPTPFAKADLSAYIYAVIALAYACASQTVDSTPDQNEKTAWEFFGYAARHIPQLMAGEPGLLSTQALLGMVSATTKLHTLD